MDFLEIISQGLLVMEAEVERRTKRKNNNNALMHKANKYKDHKPDFEKLAAQYPDFAKQYVDAPLCCQDKSGTV